ncbi:hypothetical protein K457DRAFT_142356 [Linnemannia elongata AG-77]|uniref:Activator of Hsp90 ATPase AHSA1-like N-terminal domain-containing protein n=1 Tax=Linnemannia elongata AG-77 TaxID=1314771 RepID=A0A197JHN3_9FUNG|nr:hypothetical protein K457DRAFT_142356 [Linnemannia elongata AG-77]
MSRNVNNWHWVDKNCINWAKTYFETELSGVTAEANGASVKTLAVTSVTGDVDVNQRKGKIITIFDVAISMTFEGTTADGTAVTGKIEIPEVAHDTDEDDYVFDVSIDADSSAKQPVRDLIRKSLAPLLRKKLSVFAADLIKVHGKDVQIEGEMSKPSTPVPTPTPSPAPGAKAASSGASTPTAAPGAVNTTTLEDTVELQASAHDIYDVLLNQAKVQIWTRSNKSTIVAKVGTKFSLFGGSVTGEIKELVEDKKIVQSWRQSSWPAGHFSTVTMDITQNTNSTGIKVTQEGVPIGDLDITRQNWSNYYWAEIKRTFGYVGLVTTSTTMSNDAKKSQSQSDKKQKRRRRTDSKKKRTTGGGAGAGVYTGAGLAVLTAFALGFWFSKK